MVDHLPVDRPRPRPHKRTLVLLVGRITTIKLSYWALLTVFELALPRLVALPFDDRLPYSYGAVVVATVSCVWWAVWSARADDRRLGRIARSLPTIATTFIAATAVASPASIPLLLVERQRSIEVCVGTGVCHPLALWLWVAIIAIGTLLIPLAFVVGLRPERRLEE